MIVRLETVAKPTSIGSHALIKLQLVLKGIAINTHYSVVVVTNFTMLQVKQ